MNCKAYHHFFMNLANSTKIAIIDALKESSLSVNEITQRTGEEQSKVSHNLKTLCACNILTVEQQGKQRIYSLNKETILPILKLVDQHVKKNCKGLCGKK
jgi:DNA-binding transcriptional ArsR family regulator